MRRKLSLKEIIFVASTLFGMFFGAGNLIFPVHLGQVAGSKAIFAIIGFCITAVSVPILGVVALGNTHSSNVYELSCKVSKKFGFIFTILLYLTIGPLFAVPRCATTSFSAGVAPLLNNQNIIIPQLIFTFLFFLLVLIISLRPHEIMKWVGKVINPLFLSFYLLLVIIALVNPGGSITSAAPAIDPVSGVNYQDYAFSGSFIEGYNTMDALAGLCFGIVVVDIIKGLGVKEDKDVARGIIYSGLFAAGLFIIIYSLSIIMGAQSRGLFPVSENGGIALSQIANHYLGLPGNIILALILLLACLKTAISVVTSCGQMFQYLFPKGLKYKTVIYILCIFSFAISNIGLTKIIEYSLPVLKLLYPISFVLIFLGLFEKSFEQYKTIYRTVIVFTFIPAFCDFLKALPFNIDMSFASELIPFFDYGFGWAAPAVIGLLIALGINMTDNKESDNDE